MLGWIKSKVQKASADAMRDDLSRFILSLRGSDSAELATLLVISTCIRLQLVKSGVLSQAWSGTSAVTDYSADDFSTIKLNAMIGQFQKARQPSDAAGAMIWLHSLRALQTPEIRFLGRSMWHELRRGFSELDVVGPELAAISPKIPGGVAVFARFIPVGLEPEIS